MAYTNPLPYSSSFFYVTISGQTFQVGPYSRVGTLDFLLEEMSVPGNSFVKVAVIRKNGLGLTSGGSTPITADITFIDGTAINGVDYFGTNTTLTFTTTLVGFEAIIIEYLKYVNVRIAQITATKTFTIRLTVTGILSFLTYTEEIDVTINPVAGAAGSVGFQQTAQAGIAGTTINAPVGRFGGAVGAVSVAYHTEDGTGVAGVDYTAASGTLNWADGDTTPQNVAVTLLNPASEKTFKIVLDTPTGGVIVQPPPNDECTVTIFPTVALAAGQIGFKFLSYQTPESTTLTITLQRLGGKTGAVSITYQTANGTASAGTDYTAAGPTVVNWANDDEAEKTFNITILGGAIAPVDFLVNLTLPTGGATIRTGYGQTRALILGGTTNPVSPVTDVIADFVGYVSADLYDELFQSYNRQDSQVRMADALAGGVMGFGGGSSNFGGGGDYASGDETLDQSPPNRFSVQLAQIRTE